MRVTSGQAQLAVEVNNAAARPRVLLLHAGVTDKRSWQPLVAALGSGVATIAFDRRGYGETTYEPEEHSHVDDAVAVLDVVGASEPVVVIGASMGGRLALDLALAHPERVAALVLIGSAVRGEPESGFPEPTAEEQRLEAAFETAGEDLDAVNRIEAHYWLDGPGAPEGRVSGAVRDLFLDMNGIELRSPDPGEQRELASAYDRLGEIGVPVLVLVGDLDEGQTRWLSAQLAERIPGARFETLADTAHLPHMEGHARCLEAVREFVSGL
ncbi:MAG TPA: alpha/beta hydrolase [Solirubrobacteraceae bacterium]